MFLKGLNKNRMIWTFGIMLCIVVLAMGCGKKGDLKKKRTMEQKYSKSFG